MWCGRVEGGWGGWFWRLRGVDLGNLEEMDDG